MAAAALEAWDAQAAEPRRFPLTGGVRLPPVTASGGVMAVAKNSSLCVLASNQTVTFHANGTILQDFAYRVTGNASAMAKVNFMYPFMTIMPLSEALWVARLANGTELRGQFTVHEGNFTLQHDILWDLLYNPRTQVIAILIFSG